MSKPDRQRIMAALVAFCERLEGAASLFGRPEDSWREAVAGVRSYLAQGARSKTLDSFGVRFDAVARFDEQAVVERTMSGLRFALAPNPSVHALDRYREHYPDADADALLRDLMLGERVTPEVAASLVNRRQSDLQCAYVVARGRKGMFVVKRGGVITYLRFGSTQEALVRRWFDEGRGLSENPEN